MIPFLVKFSPLTVATQGLEAVYPGSQVVIDGVALVTGFLALEGWTPPTPVVTGWTQCSAAVTTTWTDTYAQPVTGWSLIA